MTDLIAHSQHGSPLTQLTGARNALEQARTLTEVKAIHDVAVAAKRYAEACKLGEESVRYAQEIVLRATRRMGEILAETPKATGGGDQRSNHRSPSVTGGQRLSDIGVTKNQSSTAQKLANVSDADFEEYVTKAREPTRSGILKEARLADKAERVAKIAEQEPAPIQSTGPFPVLYVDPPWRYEDAEPTRAIENNYPTMSLDEIKALDIPAADDTVLFLWATSPKLSEALEVMAAWNFTYRTNMVWVKDRIGMGYYARQQHELLLIGKRGALPVPDPEDRPSSVITAPRGLHSAKPDVVYELIERMYPFAERCELFARTTRDGWAGWGNQATP